MSTTSQKHRTFVAEPMNDKSVTDLAGIGEVLGRRLESKGFDKAYVVLGQVMAMSALNQIYPERVYPKQLTANCSHCYFYHPL